MNEQQLLAVWRQTKIPVLFRRDGADLLVKLPFDLENQKWLWRGRASKPTWNVQWKCWGLPRSAFNELARRSIERFGEVYLIQPLNPDQECCAACQNAKGLDCECGCLGRNHGLASRGQAWFHIASGEAADYKGRKYQVQKVDRPAKIVQGSV
jgi:hypothetical protein